MKNKNILIQIDFIRNLLKEDPIRFVDVGAARGLHARWNDLKKYMYILGFEPDEREFAKLERSKEENAKYFNIGLYERSGEIDLYVTKKQLRSSIYPLNKDFVYKFPNPERFDTEKVIKINVDSLDNQLKQAEIDNIDIIKIDTQGSELPILKGAIETLKNRGVISLEVEVEFAQIYESQPLFSDVDNYLRNFGYQLFSLDRYHWKRTIAKNIDQKKAQLIYADAIYFDRYNRIIECVNGNREKLKSKIFKSILIFVKYGFLDYALEICEKAKDDRFINKYEHKEITNAIVGSVCKIRRIPDFKGKFIIANILYKLYDYFKPNPWVEIDDD